MGDAWIIDTVRTPRGKGKKDTGALSGVHPQELMAQVLNATQARTGIDPHDVEDVVVGCVSEAGEQGGCIARMAVLAAGWPHEATGVVLNRFCGLYFGLVHFFHRLNKLTKFALQPFLKFNVTNAKCICRKLIAERFSFVP